MNLYFTKTKRLMFDENGETPKVIYVSMGEIDGDLIDIMKEITLQCEEMNKHNVYIYEGSTSKKFCYAVVGTKWQSEKIK